MILERCWTMNEHDGFIKGVTQERSRLIRLAHAIEDEGLPLTSALLDRLAHTVLETGPLQFSSESTEDGVRWRMNQSMSVKDLRDA
jgi:hypothetical protein